MKKSKYTICDQEKEHEIKKILYEIAHDLKTHFHYEKSELTYQRHEAKLLLELAERYKILHNAAPGVHLYPDSATNRMTYELENKCKKISESLEYVQPLYKLLDEKVRKLDWLTSSETITGDYNVKPLQEYLCTVSDLKRDFQRRVIDRQVVQDMFNILFGITVEVYVDLLEHQEEFSDIFAKAVFFSEIMNV
ncbi:uncharacterized protein LOC119656912 isoform X2 [Hermetia illucens]|uniref:uncharacterized protein LOC119656912 isoform X2 n=1 Tax=Hermetia illucens TaxID=343691 RepID=UPI0018CC502F|nr:uncharacterized protein LOC119656912 isoform X2 [Hermetia illucens]